MSIEIKPSAWFAESEEYLYKIYQGVGTDSNCKYTVLRYPLGEPTIPPYGKFYDKRLGWVRLMGNKNNPNLSWDEVVSVVNEQV